MSSVDSIVARLTTLHPKRIDLSLDRLQRLLAALDHPEKKLPPVIHVAGTNGKGSTVAFLRAILEAAGQRVHAYTSPHLVRFNERFRIGGPGGSKLVSDDELVATMEECERANAGGRITVFEITTAAGLCCSRVILRMCCCWRLVLVAGSMQRTWSTTRWPRLSRAFRSITPIFLAIHSTRLRLKRPAYSNVACRRLLPRNRATHWR